MELVTLKNSWLDAFHTLPSELVVPIPVIEWREPLQNIRPLVGGLCVDRPSFIEVVVRGDLGRVYTTGTIALKLSVDVATRQLLTHVLSNMGIPLLEQHLTSFKSFQVKR